MTPSLVHSALGILVGEHIDRLGGVDQVVCDGRFGCRLSLGIEHRNVEPLKEILIALVSPSTQPWLCDRRHTGALEHLEEGELLFEALNQGDHCFTP